ncbi:MAG: hypothetical protein QW728_00835 [Thermoplasmata archaeon]
MNKAGTMSTDEFHEQDKEQIEQILEASRFCSDILGKRNAAPQGLSNSLLLATSFLRYNKWDKVRTYTTQSQRSCEKADKELFEISLRRVKLLKRAEALSEMVDFVQPEHQISEIESLLLSGNYLEAGSLLQKLESDLLKTVETRWLELVEDTEDMIYSSRTDGISLYSS